MPTVIPVKFKYAARDLWFSPADTGAQEGDHVICTTERGQEIGLAVGDAHEVTAELLSETIGHSQLRDVMRIATDDDLDRAEELADRGERAMAQSRYVNVWLDCHLDRTSLKLDVTGPAGVRNLVAKTRGRIADAKRCGMPVMVGTWSASLPMPDSAMTPEGRIALERIYTSEQLGAYEKLPAWFFQTWKTSGLLVSWDARLALATFERGMLS